MLKIKKTEWDLSPLLKSDNDPTVSSRRKEVEKRASVFIKKWKSSSEYLQNPSTLRKALDEYEELSKGTFGKGEMSGGNNEGYYFWLRSQQDLNDPKIKAKYNSAEEFSKKVANELIFFDHSLSKIPEKKQNEFLKSPELKKYKHYLEKLFASAKHLLSEESEKIMSLKESPANDKWTNMVAGFIAKESQIVLTDQGLQKKHFEEILSLMNNQDKKIRDAAAEKFNEIMLKHSDVAEAEINAILANKKINDELRKFPQANSARLLADDISEKFVSVLQSAVSEKFKTAQDFYKLKASLLSQKKLQYHERNIAYGNISKKYSYEDSINLVYEVFSNLDSKFAEILKRFVDNSQIDVFPRKGKRGGAFCVYWLITHPTYIMLNHTNELNDVRTLAHELGHGINNELIKESQHALYFGTPTSTAEVASTFMEDFVFDRLLKEANDELKLSLLMQKLNNDISTIFRQIACYNFEIELHKEFRKQGYLSKEEIGKIFQKHMSSYMGEFVEQSPGSENWWVYWSHIRQFFYVYSYSSGLLISKALQNKVKSNPEYIQKVKQFLSAGLSDSPENIFKSIGIDITKKEFWLSGLKEVQNLLEETEKLAKKLGKI